MAIVRPRLLDGGLQFVYPFSLRRQKYQLVLLDYMEITEASMRAAIRERRGVTSG
jgi:hypothetical protein